jgi:hypothetical protein
MMSEIDHDAEAGRIRAALERKRHWHWTDWMFRTFGTTEASDAIPCGCRGESHDFSCTYVL